MSAGRFFFRHRRRILACCGVVALLVLAWQAAMQFNWNRRYRVGQEIDRLNGVAVFYNGGVGHTSGRNLTPDGYNLGLKFQCVEFVKRYYYEHLHHRMPDTLGNARDFFAPALPDGATNLQRGLLQFTNGSQAKPRPDDLVVFGPSLLNRYGHVAIVSAVTDSAVQIVQQNAGPFSSSRESIPLRSENGRWRLENRRIFGWLRKDAAPATPTPHADSPRK